MSIVKMDCSSESIRFNQWLNWYYGARPIIF